MKINRFVRATALSLGLSLAALAVGCGPAPLSQAEQTKVDTAIQKEHAGRHREVKDAQKQQAGDQRNQAASRKAAHKAP